ncbi:ATPase inhibitor mai-2, mitochondrial [Dufourea novaeangliae]|uniref:Regulatory protein zeste n=1 Tax=Dufourea novaeangliae TaxID=178035 RepID=A0A154PKZ1_DUFNO|nr:ATPase inhibitor mai-2, mitochondrial [Dufourea novaeangliae]
MSSNATTVLLKKRERTQNWIPEEKNALFTLIKAHVNAIENKKVDAAASAMKNLAWQQIHCDFRGRFSTDRDITRIKEQWRRMKAQARMEMHTFLEKVKNTGPEEAAKCRPSNLSIEVWKLMGRARKNDVDGERSDENSQESPENSTNLQAILDKLTATSPEMPVNEIKVEAESDEYNTDEESRAELFRKNSDGLERKRARIFEDEPMDLAEQKRCNEDTTIRHFDNGLAGSSLRERYGRTGGEEETIQKSIWLYEMAQREHDLKLNMLNIELKRAELQKQTAINELKTSEIKKQLIESQAAEYYRLYSMKEVYSICSHLTMQRAIATFSRNMASFSQMRMSGERGSGAGKGGGGGGAIRDAGGSFGKMEAAHEDQYFYNLQKEQFQKLKEDLHDEISFHEEQIKRHQEAINRHKQRITDMNEK